MHIQIYDWNEGVRYPVSWSVTKRSVYHCNRYLSVTVPILKKDTKYMYADTDTRYNVDEHKQ